MSSSFMGFDCVQAHSDDKLVLTDGGRKDHLDKLEAVLKKFVEAGI